ncbi:Signal transduction histidine kinase [Tistlia consotensis]|uniref:histidine kinase n=1 Tax=Tistlia consotensis USBA 355 TaxID=560819 RepID=A0A1Y6BX24_9PROT|nr:ATP-binding protein [Tistlia consotensis]SMF32303.1 Signal transduction histidine kinase [Tistlia consotensis USBA 355]SNR68355.1 Signal transduction histidine kinase [Tistlia consotensis]
MSAASPDLSSRRLKRVTLFGSLAIAVLLVLFVGASLWSERRETLRAAENLALSQLQSFAHAIGLTLVGVETVLDVATARVAADGPGDPRLSDYLHNLVRRIGSLRAVLVIDGEGRIVADSRPGRPAVGFNAGSRSYYLLPRAGRIGKIFIGRPVLSFLDGQWALPLSKAVRGPQGELLAVVVASISPRSLAEGVPASDIDQNRRALLARADGALLMQLPGNGFWPRTSLADTPLFEQHLRRDGLGVFETSSLFDDKRRLVAYRRLEGFPLVAAVGLTDAFVLQRFWSHLFGFTGLLLVALAVLTGATVLQLRSVSAMSRRNRELAQAYRIAYGANRAKSQFLARMSHDLRTPLNAIAGFSELMTLGILGPLPERYRQYAEHIRSSSLHLHSLVQDLLDLSRAESGRLTLNDEEAVAIGKLVEDCLNLMEGAARDRSVRLDNRLPSETPRVYCDPIRIKQILINLLTNAADYLQPGAVVRLELERGAEGDLRLVVADDGPGIAPEILAAAQGDDEQLDPLVAAKTRGSGLGLSIAFALARLHGGVLEIDSGPDRGTCAVLRLPASRVLATTSATEPGLREVG